MFCFTNSRRSWVPQQRAEKNAISYLTAQEGACASSFSFSKKKKKTGVESRREPYTRFYLSPKHDLTFFSFQDSRDFAGRVDENQMRKRLALLEMRSEHKYPTFLSHFTPFWRPFTCPCPSLSLNIFLSPSGYLFSSLSLSISMSLGFSQWRFIGFELDLYVIWFRVDQGFVGVFATSTDSERYTATNSL